MCFECSAVITAVSATAASPFMVSDDDDFVCHTHETLSGNSRYPVVVEGEHRRVGARGRDSWLEVQGWTAD